jgi:hypothetical protein
MSNGGISGKPKLTSGGTADGIWDLEEQHAAIKSGSWLPLGSESNPAVSGKAIYAANPSSPSGNYWLKSPGGTVYQAYIKMDYGGGWINLNKGALGPYATPLTSGWGSGGGDMLTGGSTTPLAPLGASFVTNQQSYYYSCSGGDARSYIDVNAQLWTDLGITEVRYNCSCQNMDGNVVCGYFNSAVSYTTIVSGTANMMGVCNNTPNRYSDVNPGSFTAEAIGTPSVARRVYSTQTACGGSYQMRVNQLYVR